MNEVLVSGVVSNIETREKVLEATLVGKHQGGAFFRVRVKAFGKVKEALEGFLTEGQAVGVLGSLIAREQEGKPAQVEVAAQKAVVLSRATVGENAVGPYLEGAINQVFLSGYLGKDPELRYIPTGTEEEEPSAIALLTASLAVRQGERTIWVPLKAWGEVAEAAAEVLSKGSFVVLEGRYRLEHYEREGENF